MTAANWNAPAAYELGFDVLAALGEPLHGDYPCDGAAYEPLTALSRSDSIAYADVDAELPLDGLVLGLGLDAVTYEPETFPFLVFDSDETSAPVIATRSGLLVVPWVVDEAVAVDHLAPVHDLLTELGRTWSGELDVRIRTVDEILSG
ncbi:hypothetical protein [Halorientalis halophila]|uniref:hypothetical protein n=1 Tax=Halorientalis halophila TaxID=3108499 RepID=UPI003009A93C